MSTLRAALAAAVVSLATAAPVQNQPVQEAISATPWVELPASRVRLVAGQAKVTSDRYLAGLEIVMAEGWKTYWRMPGDAGVPPTFDWAGSSNVAAIKVLYPAPARMPEAGGETIGYQRSVLLPIEVNAHDPAKPVVLKLALEYGICREICIPTSAALEFSLAPGRMGAPAREIAAALERVPRAQASRRKQDPDLKRVEVNRDGSVARLSIEAVFPGGGKGADVFVEAPAGLYVPLPKRAAANAGGLLRFESELSRDLVQDLKGKTLTLTLVSEAGATEAQWPFPERVGP
jgi:DsbC/DsbD-like thiol-disulfide interchange protein